MLYYLENLLKLPKISIQNVLQEGQNIFIVLTWTEEEVQYLLNFRPTIFNRRKIRRIRGKKNQLSPSIFN